MYRAARKLIARKRESPPQHVPIRIENPASIN
jgi:hypothetical protein